MLAYTYHRAGYNVGLAILLVSTVTYVVSFGLPYWFSYGDKEWLTIQATDVTNVWNLCVQTNCYNVQDDDTSLFSRLYVDNSTEKVTNHGLWLICLQSGCHVIKGGVNMWSQAMGCACLALMVVSTSLAGIVSFCPHRVQSRTRTPEIVTAIGSTMGFIGAFIFLASKFDEVHSSELDASLDWAFALSVLAAAGGLLSAFILSFFNKFVPTRRPYFFLSGEGQLVKLGTGGGGKVVSVRPDRSKLGGRGQPGSSVYTVS